MIEMCLRALEPRVPFRSPRLSFALWIRRRRGRLALERLEAAHLRDIGVSEVERDRECGKWFWTR